MSPDVLARDHFLEAFDVIRWTCSIPVLVVLLLVGCGQSAVPTATIQGAVSVDGVAIDEGMISFTPMDADMGTGASAPIRGGRYQAEGVPQGRLMVRFHARKETGRTIADEVEGGGAETVDVIPPKYGKGLEITVTTSAESHDFELDSR